MKYELICACGDHIKLVEDDSRNTDDKEVYIGYCIGCDQGFVMRLKILNTFREMYYHRKVKEYNEKRL
jgi:hypothetical protein